MTSDKIKNIIDMAIGFTAMGRVFESNSSEQIGLKLEELLGRIDKEGFEKIHASFCDWFMNNIKTNKGERPSYGQAAKVLDVTLKVIVYNCGLPKAPIAENIIPRLHCAIDTPILLYLKRKHRVGKGIFTISKIDRDTYCKFQSILNQEAKDAGLMPVEYDDALWRRLSKERNG